MNAGEANMTHGWVVLLEVACAETGPLAVATLEALLGRLADRHPSALQAPDRYALQFLVDGGDADSALAEGVSLWRQAARDVGVPDGGVVRAEVKTPAELEAECSHEEHGPSGSADERALAAAYEATRRLLRSSTPREVVSVLRALVRELGGTLLPPRPGDPRILDIDLSLGMGKPMLAAVEPYSIDRLCLEEVLPAVVEDARRMISILPADSAADDVAGSDRNALADFDQP
jgi:hypothetical protein